ncbi:4'-phosphopantetheinyl transferase family protein [Mesorhizobium sp. CO1-1-8]|uniref:4'-phosphopantetheinyl transferase family protein n=1 Tax=Mesorhizobium sp. CO1-1-8 TaxID=2876631 RepID=UPI001CD0B0BA|nr:4'-phosphopantetheinyl transferase superfamily protein [Mesorhizobium sp. CO1-1-8]MBZ9770986.1 4'-phosphopantetheinyl transferase superfamily protein [Mesorhizobium sp. CO1-1-8]
MARLAPTMPDAPTKSSIVPVGEAEVDVVAASDAISDVELLSRYEALLTDDDRHRYSQQRFEEGRRRFLITRALARYVLSINCGVASDDLVFGADQWGKPMLLHPCENRVAFNIAHTSGLIVVAVARADAIGVDIEYPSPIDENFEIAQRFFSAKEVEALRALPPKVRDERFFDYWTLKEAYVKGRGVGLSLPFNCFAIDFRDGSRPRLAVEPNVDDGRKWQLDLMSLSSGHRLAVAVELPPSGRPFEVRLSRAVPFNVLASEQSGETGPSRPMAAGIEDQPAPSKARFPQCRDDVSSDCEV